MIVRTALLAAPAALSLLLAAPAFAQAAPKSDTNAVSGRLGSFTPSGRTTGSLAAADRFAFTPAKKEAGDKVRVDVIRRVDRGSTQPAAVESTASRAAATTGPTSMQVGADVGYAGFSLSGEYDRAPGEIEGSERERVQVGFGYEARKWRADVRAGASQPADQNIYVPAPLGESVSLEVGGAVALNPRLSLKGGVRYDRINPEAFTRDFVNRDEDTARENSTVYLGGSLSF
ncbi:MAG: hypothetical protein V2J26_12465 [Pacificimonas sp.]|jgi:hypothetical protein|nr:hypothetical protein [Pacificimonas sp.]